MVEASWCRIGVERPRILLLRRQANSNFQYSKMLRRLKHVKGSLGKITSLYAHYFVIVNKNTGYVYHDVCWSFPFQFCFANTLQLSSRWLYCPLDISWYRSYTMYYKCMINNILWYIFYPRILGFSNSMNPVLIINNSYVDSNPLRIIDLIKTECNKWYIAYRSVLICWPNLIIYCWICIHKIHTVTFIISNLKKNTH